MHPNPVGTDPCVPPGLILAPLSWLFTVSFMITQPMPMFSGSVRLPAGWCEGLGSTSGVGGLWAVGPTLRRQRWAAWQDACWCLGIAWSVKHPPPMFDDQREVWLAQKYPMTEGEAGVPQDNAICTMYLMRSP